MTRTIVICADGSDLAIDAALQGLKLLKDGDRTILLTISESPDQALLVGSSGFAGGTVTPAAFTELQEASAQAAALVIQETLTALGDAAPANIETQSIMGSPGPAICSFAADSAASVIVLGSRGHGGLKRAVLGSVSDHVVRHAPCAVLIFGDVADHQSTGQ
jgi:nucleotide-binding universal stress UspA family protein